MESKPHKYTITFTQDPSKWDIPQTIRLLETAREQAAKLDEANIESALASSDFKEANELIAKIKKGLV